jgi:hypothetical protein
MGCGASIGKTETPGISPEKGEVPDAATLLSLANSIAQIKLRVESIEGTSNIEARLAALESAISCVRNTHQPDSVTPVDGGVINDLAIVKGGENFLCDAAAPIRAEFLSQKWIPFLRELKEELLSAEARFLSGFGPEELLPSQRRVEELTEKCASLTLAWHGARNYSVIYEWLVELHDVDRSTYPYRFEELPMERSADGWVRVVDGNVRKSLYTTPNTGASALDVGGLKQYMGDSAIDNTVLPNIMPAGEAHLLLAGGAIKRMYAKRLASQQADILSAVSAFFLAKGVTEWSELRCEQPRRPRPCR